MKLRYLLFFLILASFNPIIAQSDDFFKIETNQGLFLRDSIATAIALNSFFQFRSTKYQYDTENRITKIDETNSITTFTYSENSKLEELHVKPNGRLLYARRSTYNDEGFQIGEKYQSFSDFEPNTHFTLDTFIRNSNNLVTEFRRYGSDGVKKEIRYKTKSTYSQVNLLVQLDETYYGIDEVIQSERVTNYRYNSAGLLLHADKSYYSFAYLYGDTITYVYDDEYRVRNYTKALTRDGEVYSGERVMTEYEGEKSISTKYDWQFGEYKLAYIEEKVKSNSPFYANDSLITKEIINFQLARDSEVTTTIVAQSPREVQLRLKTASRLSSTSSSQVVSKIFFRNVGAIVPEELPSFSVNPNPARANQIAAANTGGIQHDAYIIYNSLGQLISKEPSLAEKQIIFQAPGTAGTYYIALLVDNARVSKTVRFIVVD